MRRGPRAGRQSGEFTGGLFSNDAYPVPADFRGNRRRLAGVYLDTRIERPGGIAYARVVAAVTGGHRDFDLRDAAQGVG